MKKIGFILIAFFGLLFACFSQRPLPPGQYTSKNKKAISQYEEGLKAGEFKNDAQAEKSFRKAIDLDNNFLEAYLGLATLYQYNNRHEEAITNFKKAIEINPKFFPNSFYFISISELFLGKYEEAKTNLETFLKFERINPNTRENATTLLKNATFGAEAIKNPKPFNPISIGQGINTDLDEYFPAITGDGKQFLFTRSLKEASVPDYQNEDFFMSIRSNNQWQEATPIREINSPGNEGAPTLSADGNIMFFASCEVMPGDYGSTDRRGFGSCDIFYSQRIDGKWSKPRNAGPEVNTNHWETQPSFSSDGKTLYFIRGIRTREGRIREQDIYMSAIGDDGRFTTAVKLDSNVNTKYKEESVFIHPDNMTLYFSSDGHVGMGGLDIFMSKRQPNGNWGPAINLGYPINTFDDENSFLVDPAGKLAYFASNRKGGEGGLDIYQFELPESVRPEKITYVKGKIYNARNKEPLEANFELYDMETQQLVTRYYSSANGEFMVVLNENHNYIVNVNKQGFLFYSDNFSLKGVETDFNKPFQIDIPLEPIDLDAAVELKNVFFDVDKWNLKPESKAELDKLSSFLKNNPGIKIELSGHTDNTGDKKSNLTLSTNRAKAVYDHLINEGKISPERLSFIGYGDTKPKVPNDTPENKAKNRRTEFRITGK